jgi:catalase
MNHPVLTAFASATAILTHGALAQSPASAAAPVDPNTFPHQFQATFEKFGGYRRSGAKGICVMAELTGTADARALSNLTASSGQAALVIVRLAVGMVTPKALDNATSLRNMAL